MDHLVSKEKRETEVCPDPKVLLVARAMVVSLELLVLSAPLVPLVCLVLKVLREPRGQLALLVQKETLVQLVLLVLLAHQVKLSSLCPSSHPRRPSAPVTCSQMRLLPSWTTAREWRTSSARLTTSNRTSNA